MTPFFRPNTWDKEIWHSIVTHNEYNITDNWNGTVIDIGGHIGSFSYFMLQHKQAHKAIVVEPDPDNFRVLSYNLQQFISSNKAIAINAGIGPPETKLICAGNIPDNTGGINYIPNPDGIIDTIPLDSLIELAGDTPILLKLDCEGCEYDALENCKLLNKISAMIGEFHGRNNYNIKFIENILINNNFEFDYRFTSDSLGLFAAHQKIH